MPVRVLISKSPSAKKKMQAVFYDSVTGKKIKTVQFGAKGYEDFTTHRDVQRRARYIHRHSNGREQWSNPMTAGTLSRYVLWNKKTLQASIRDYKKRFHLL